MIKQLFKRLLNEDRGIAAIEYGLLALLFAVALVGSFTSIGGDVQESYEDTGDQYTQANAV